MGKERPSGRACDKRARDTDHPEVKDQRPICQVPQGEGLGILVKSGREQRGPGLHALIQAPWEGRTVWTNWVV